MPSSASSEVLPVLVLAVLVEMAAVSLVLMGVRVVAAEGGQMSQRRRARGVRTHHLRTVRSFGAPLITTTTGSGRRGQRSHARHVIRESSTRRRSQRR